MFGRRGRRGGGGGGGSTAQGGLKVNGLVKESVAEENHQGEETELEVAEREESPSALDARSAPAGCWGALGEAGGPGQGSVGGTERYSLGFAGGPGFIGADDEEREKD